MLSSSCVITLTLSLVMAEVAVDLKWDEHDCYDKIMTVMIKMTKMVKCDNMFDDTDNIVVNKMVMML